MKQKLIGLLSLLLLGSQGLQGSAAAPADLHDDELLRIILNDDAQAMASYLNDHPKIKNKKEVYGEPLLYKAVLEGAYEIVSLLLMRGWDYHVIYDEDGTTLWHATVQFKSSPAEIARALAIAKLLVNYPDLDINAQESTLQMTPLMMAVDRGMTSMVKFLLDHDADATMQTIFGATALDHEGNDEIREMLEKAVEGK